MPDNEGSRIKRRMPLPGESEKKKPARQPEQVRNIIILGAAVVAILLTAVFVLMPGGRSTPVSTPDESITGEQTPGIVIEAPAEENRQVICPVCKTTLISDKAEFRHKIEGTDVTCYFDTETCYTQFLDHPEQYVDDGTRYKISVKVQPKPSEVPDPSGSEVPFIQDVPLDGNVPEPDMVPDTPADDSLVAEPPAENPDASASPGKAPVEGGEEKTAPSKSSSGSSKAPEIIDIPVEAMPPAKKDPGLKTTPIQPPPGGQGKTY